ncbi:MAG: phytanoyl-CoA dioxygenase [Piscirickettsiaceae bacterium]|nr:MAG: phytanoyl-CoA dioxygenase [Piscirickettsiaceae bacterium]PCI71578.1 MAG: phytanoyl-CoA dioxygenase [Piscirickettsiaceae bacterium]
MRDGYVKLAGFASSEMCKRMVTIVENSIEPALGPLEYEAEVHYPGAPCNRGAKGGDTPRRLLHAYARDDVFRHWACAPSVVKVVKQLMGADNVLLTQNHHNCIMTKLPVFSSQTDWHQDIRYWSFDRPQLVNVWLALGDEYKENGGMKMIPGSHTMEFERGRLDANLFLRQDLPENQNLLETAVDVELEAGDVLFFHCRTFHAAGANNTDKPKYSLVFSYHAADNLPIPETRSARLDSVSID